MTRRPRFRRIALVAGALIALAAITLGLRFLRGRPPAVDGAGLWIGTVERGDLRLTVRGTGALVPEEVRWAAAPMAARVEKVLVLAGAEVEPDTVLIELANPDAELAVLDAERELAGANAELARLAASLDSARLAQESVIAGLDADRAIASRRAGIEHQMAADGVSSSLESAESADRAEQLAGRLSFEKRRLATMRRGDAAQLEAQRGEVERLRALAAFRRKQLDGLEVRAGTHGVVQEVAIEVGQAVSSGAPLAKVVRPDRLKAELRVPETAAQDLRIGLSATIDTRNGTVAGKVKRVDPAARNGYINVDVAFDGPLPPGARPDLTVDGEVELAFAGDRLHVQRPARGEAHATVSLWKLTGGGVAVRVPVTFGRASTEQIEITAGLAAGDRIILSDMSRWDGHDRLRVE
jgi:multidrug efflux pump subunit AcrA (membrane-fusion protein)